ncbi:MULTISPECIES: nuclear transport factor 2 family protein [unclassified Marinobacter]|uniref:nuclear transport factor 2 family protein n=1 Tax=unclassified Marinobacter TaxID=83889 RepID=UPI001926A1B3|nr:MULTISPECIES: nuclear transport factor 2 family protein [unclassified Marinobacter]MBL3825560.1 nuclear transport factor 2 family protein [Marinobacter sp. MC3]MBL3894126.1 nuclear transport factor 2 family protein [Marinobacter sp. MW3]
MTTASKIEVGTRNSAVPATLDNFRALFNELDKGNLNKLSRVYSEDIRFQDPLNAVQGLDDLTHYFAEAYANVISCRFEFGDAVVQGEFAALPWVMYLRHKRIRKGREVQVQGMSHLEIRDGMVCYHRDYFDAGEMLYENLPVVGRVIRWIKDQAG